MKAEKKHCPKRAIWPQIAENRCPSKTVPIVWLLHRNILFSPSKKDQYFRHFFHGIYPLFTLVQTPSNLSYNPQHNAHNKDCTPPFFLTFSLWLLRYMRTAAISSMHEFSLPQWTFSMWRVQQFQRFSTVFNGFKRFSMRLTDENGQYVHPYSTCFPHTVAYINHIYKGELLLVHGPHEYQTKLCTM